MQSRKNTSHNAIKNIFKKSIIETNQEMIELIDKHSKRVIIMAFHMFEKPKGQQFFSVKGLTVNNLGFPGHMVSVTITVLSHC